MTYTFFLPVESSRQGTIVMELSSRFIRHPVEQRESLPTLASLSPSLPHLRHLLLANSVESTAFFSGNLTK